MREHAHAWAAMRAASHALIAVVQFVSRREEIAMVSSVRCLYGETVALARFLAWTVPDDWQRAA